MRPIFRILSVVLGALLVVVLWRAVPVVAIGVAYKAKMLCAGTFVSHRDPDAVAADLQTGDLAILRFVRASVDREARSVTASALGAITRRAVYRDGLGCALVLDGLTPPAAPAGGTEPVPAPGPDDPIFARPDPQAASAALSAALDRAFADPDPQRLRRTQAVVVVHRGRIAGERYAVGIGRDTALIGWSLTKSVMNALVGVLVEEGRLTVTAPAPIAEWQTPGDPRAAITVEHLLRMSSGLRFDEGMESPASDVMRMLLAVGDAAAFAANKELIAAPGTSWSYSSGSANLIARAIRSSVGEADYLSFPRRALFDRIGMTSAVLETDAAGTFIGSSFMYATARDWARLGVLYLRDGAWNGVRVLPRGWVAYSTSPAPADPRKHYGADFWLEIPEEYGGAGCHLPAGTFHAAGHEGQFVTIVPARDAVIVRLGRTRVPGAWNHCAFVNDVLAVLGDSR